MSGGICEKFSRTTRSNPWTRPMTSSRMPRSISNAIQNLSNPQPAFLKLPNHSDPEMVLDIDSSLSDFACTPAWVPKDDKLHAPLAAYCMHTATEPDTQSDVITQLRCKNAWRLFESPSWLHRPLLWGSVGPKVRLQLDGRLGRGHFAI
jgi:hypothetical protein